MTKVYCVNCTFHKASGYVYHNCHHPNNIHIVDTPICPVEEKKQSCEKRNANNMCVDYVALG